jgi:peptidyl-prolyl cis-trans isomerase SurA
LKSINRMMFTTTKRKFIAALFFCLSAAFAFSQPQNIDKVIGTVGKYVILKSDYESLKLQYASEGMTIDSKMRCRIIEELLYQKLLLSQADKDSVDVKDEQVDAEISRRMNYYIHQFGSEEKFESFYGKTVDQFKEELRDDVKQQLIVQQMQGRVTGDIKVTPAEIRNFFNTIPEDSLPLINSEVELGQIVRKPAVSDAAKEEARTRLEGYRQRVIKGESSMSTLAALYTEDPGSAKTGGRYDGIMRGQFVPEFEAIAFRLKPDEVSEIFETQYGLHFMQLIARRGEMVDVRHILITPKISNLDVLNAKVELDSVYQRLKDKRITFCEAAQKYSEDKETKNNCGTMINMQTGNSRFETDELGQIDQNLIFLLDKMEVGDFTKPTLYQTPESKQAYRIIYLKTRTLPHRANLKDDYQRLQNFAIANKQKKIVKDWIGKKAKNTYVRLIPEYLDCEFENNWNLQPAN